MAPIPGRSLAATPLRSPSSSAWRRRSARARRRPGQSSMAASGLGADAAGDYRPAFTLLSARGRQPGGTRPIPAPRSTSIRRPAAIRSSLAAGSRSWSRRRRCGPAPDRCALQPGVARSARCFTNSEPSDGRISVTYGNPCGEIADGSSTMAIGGAYYATSDVRMVNGVSYWRITKGMIVTDNPPTSSRPCRPAATKRCWPTSSATRSASATPPPDRRSCTRRSRNDCWTLRHRCRCRSTTGRHGDDVPDDRPGPARPAHQAVSSTVTGSTVTITWSAPVGAAARRWLPAAGRQRPGTRRTTGRSTPPARRSSCPVYPMASTTCASWR